MPFREGFEFILLLLGEKMKAKNEEFGLLVIYRLIIKKGLKMTKPRFSLN
jgi:hypothetical protein